MTQKIVPNLWFAGNAGEAGEFYATALPRTTAHVAMRLLGMKKLVIADF